MNRRPFILIAVALLAACGTDTVTGTRAPRTPTFASPTQVVGIVAVQGDEGQSLVLSSSSTLPTSGGPLSISWDFADGSPLATSTSTDGNFSMSHTWDDNASAPYEAYATITSSDGQTEAVRFDVTVFNVAPTATFVAPATANAGAPFTLSVTNPSDPSNADTQAGFQYQFDCGDGLGFGEPAPSASISCAGAAPGELYVHARISDKDGDGTIYESLVMVIDAVCTAPSGVTLNVPSDPVKMGSAVVATVAFAGASDAGTTVQLTWSDGVTSSATPSGGSATFSRTFAAAGVYTATASVSNGCGNASATAVTYTVIYDPSAGFVTGGGWIIAPAGSYPAEPSLSGKATFGFVAKYLKGANVPTGNTEFQFHANGLDFKSGTYEWLVIAGTRAQYKGEGTIKGRSGTFNFLLTAIDAGPGGANDAFRMKITDASGTVVFDNKQGSADNSNDTTLLAGGSISIKRN